jgi:hypothetical protein
MQLCGTVTGFSHISATIPAPTPRMTQENMAEGARFELADPLRGLQFSRLARSAAPSPLHIALVQPGMLCIISYSLKIRSRPPM